MQSQAIILGDSFNNTLGLIRSLGEQDINQVLILVGESDRLFISKSRYLDKKNIYHITSLKECIPLLTSLINKDLKQVILCTNDKAASFVDRNEDLLSTNFVTPMSGKSLGYLMNKAEQCTLARQCGFEVPESIIYHRGESFSNLLALEFPILLKPLCSIQGEKSDIHICKSKENIHTYLKESSQCNDFIVQEYIEKEYELNLIGVSTEFGVMIPGGIRKLRHYPTIYSPCSFGQYQSIKKLGIDITPIKKIIKHIGYQGLFSIELLHKEGKNYFLEINFRNDGLAYTVTAAGINLPAIYMSFTALPQKVNPQEIYMMDLSIDYWHVKNGSLSFSKWISDFIKTRCLLNFNSKDIMPSFFYYKNKISKRIYPKETIKE